MYKCNVCEGRDVFQALDIEDLYWLLTDVAENLGGIAVITDYETAKELLFEGMNNDDKLGYIEIDQYDYDDAYLVTFDYDDGELTIGAEFATFDGKKYLHGDCLTFVDYNWDGKCKFISDMTKERPDFEYELFVVGDLPKPKEYSYANEVHKDGKDASILIQSNVEDFVNIISEMFKDYFE